MRHAVAALERQRGMGRPTRKSNSAEPDRETRTRLLKEARRLFSAQGFGHVTVREICRAANANVAAINYHFGEIGRAHV